MKKIYSFDRFINESIRDKMTPKSSDDIRRSMMEYFERNRLRGLDKNIISTNVFDESENVYYVEYWEEYFGDINNYLIDVTNTSKELHQLSGRLGVYVCYPAVKVVEYIEKGEDYTGWYFAQEHIDPIINYIIKNSTI